MLKLITTISPKRKHKFSREDDTYPHFIRTLQIKGNKLYSKVLLGIPDFIVAETNLPEAPWGFFEVKFANRTLSGAQEKFFKIFGGVFPCYMVQIKQDGLIEIYQYTKDES